MGTEQLTAFILPLGFIAFIYLVMIRPQQKKDKKIREMRSNLKVGDEITTIGGIFGKVVKIKEDLITIEVGADKTKLTIAKWAIGNVNTEPTD